jgi:phage/plasmid-like protein (TIGR03299 family)
MAMLSSLSVVSNQTPIGEYIMAHMVETMAYAGELPWHGLGTEVSNDLTPAQMMQKAGVDWKVQEVESFIEFNGERKKTGQKSLVRSTDGRILTNVGEGWNPVQNEAAFEFFSEFVLAGDMEMHTAGSLRDGEYVWALAKVKESFDVFGEDKVDSYLLFSNPHKYGKSIDVRFTPIRVVCNNTLTLSLNQDSKNGVRLSHRTQFNPEMVKETLGLAHEKFAKYKEMAEFLGSRKVTAESLIQYYNTVFPNTSRTEMVKEVKQYEDLSRNAKLCYDALEVQPGAEFAAGTWWQADNRLHSQWFGQNQARKVIAAESAVEFATAA